MNIMTYRDRMTRWLVVRLLPNMQRVTIARFAKKSDADGYAKVLRRARTPAPIYCPI
ncbi:hypothetical protein [Alkalinema sp. FACHB-956]|uniref:hypothetical protein n=1 Tax=Alkalinema sp. FACHB-956 TaxID=2692768 RepID=UPI001682BD25|nr:hypothetical protein [Alkalinema sp. FACHB-956]MBD2327663.1 hypothetical protein [Alkalinema sp. FACHB-956]